MLTDLSSRSLPRRLINDGAELLCGPELISNRSAIDKAGYTVQNQTFGPVGAAIRFVNFTAHPSVTPGAPEARADSCATGTKLAGGDLLR